MDSEFRRQYLVRLPLPLAQLYSRAYNAKDARGRHDNCFYLFESLIKLAACPMIATYVDERRQSRNGDDALDRLLTQLALPSLGQWVGLLRELSRYFGERVDAASHPYGHLWDQINRKRRDLLGLLELYRCIRNGPDGRPAGDSKCSLLDLLHALVQYRNAVFGHGAGRVEEFYESKMGPLLFPAVNDVLQEGVFEFCGPSDARFVYISQINRINRTSVEVHSRELSGLQGQRLPVRVLSRDRADDLVPDRMAVTWPGRDGYLPLDPLLIYRENDLTEEMLFLNRDRNAKQVEYLSYTTGRTERNLDMAEAMRRLLATVTGSDLSGSDVADLQNRSRADAPLESTDSGEDASSADSTHVRIGDFELVGEIGRGGMGVVYLARQLSLGRPVALKMLSAELLGDEVATARFRREIAALGQCDHPGIVKILYSGTTDDGQLYYAMEYVPGADMEQTWRELSGTNATTDVTSLGNTTWSQALISASRRHRDETLESLIETGPMQADSGNDEYSDAKPASLSEFQVPSIPVFAGTEQPVEAYERSVARIIRDTAEALQVVHDRNIVHRDLKPANLVLTADGSRVVLMDFGLAKGASLGGATQGGGFLGTLRYSAPEQLAAASIDVGPPADVRALGVTMWELLTRRRLFDHANDEAQLANAVHQDDVPLLRTIDSGFDADLEAIVARATERRIADRIPTARQLADYLDLYLDGKPVPVRTPTLPEMLRRWVRDRRPLVGSIVSATAIVLLTTVIAFVMITHQRNKAEQLARENGELAETNRLLADEAAEARDDAIARFKQAVAAVDGLVEMTDRLSAYPRVQATRRELLRQAARDYSSFARGDSSERSLQTETARIQKRLGETLLLLDDLDEARNAFRVAEAELQKLATGESASLHDRLELADCRVQLGELAHRTGDDDGALETLMQAVDALERRSLDSSDAREWLEAKGAAQRSLAFQLADMHRFEEAIERIEDSRTTLQVQPDNANSRRQLAETQRATCRILASAGRSQAAVAAGGDAVGILEQLAADDPDSVIDREALAMSRIELANALFPLGRQAEREKLYSSAGADYALLVDALPDIPGFQRELAKCHANRAQILNELGRNHDAQDAIQQSLQLMEQLELAYGDIVLPGYEFQHAVALSTFGDIARDLNDQQLARELFEAAIGKCNTLMTDAPDDPRFIVQRAISRSRLSRLDSPNDAAGLQEAVRDLDDLSRNAPDNPYVIDAAACCYEQLGDALRETGGPQAASQYRLAIKLRQTLATAVEHRYEHARLLAHCEAPELRNLDQALTLATVLTQAHPQHGRYRILLASIHYQRSEWDRTAELLERDDGIEASLYDQCVRLFWLALTRQHQGRHEESVSEFNEACELMNENMAGHIELVKLRAMAVEIIQPGTTNDTDE